MDTFGILAKENGITREMYKARILELIRERYSVSDEISLIRQKEDKPLEYAEYDAFVESCKAQAKKEYGIEEVEG